MKYFNIWNGEKDHYKQYVVAFVDDRSRYIIHAAIIPNKESITLANELINEFEKALPPARMVIDNGREFAGAPFHTVFKNYNIKDTTISAPTKW